MSCVYSLLVKECGSWVLDTGLVGMKCHTEQHNKRATMAKLTSNRIWDDFHRKTNKLLLCFSLELNLAV